jgi:hypothetical protein
MKASLPQRGEVCSVFSTALQRPSRQGIAALIALVCLSLATVVGTLLLQAALGEQRYLSRLELESQGEWLVEAGLSRATARLAKSARYSGETWMVPGSTLGRTQNAIVRIGVHLGASRTPARHVEVSVTFSESNEPAITASRDL